MERREEVEGIPSWEQRRGTIESTLLDEMDGPIDERGGGEEAFKSGLGELVGVGREREGADQRRMIDRFKSAQKISSV